MAFLFHECSTVHPSPTPTLAHAGYRAIFIFADLFLGQSEECGLKQHAETTEEADMLKKGPLLCRGMVIPKTDCAANDTKLAKTRQLASAAAGYSKPIIANKRSPCSDASLQQLSSSAAS